MGFCKVFKRQAKQTIFPQIKSAIKQGAQVLVASLIGSLNSAVADGRITKDEAEGFVKDAVQGAYGISRTASAILVNGVHEAIAAGAEAADLEDDTDTETINLG